MSVSIEPCFSCGERFDVYVAREAEYTNFQGRCGKCGLRGPHCSSTGKAIEAWNRIGVQVYAGKRLDEAAVEVSDRLAADAEVA